MRRHCIKETKINHILDLINGHHQGLAHSFMTKWVHVCSAREWRNFGPEQFNQ